MPRDKGPHDPASWLAKAESDLKAIEILLASSECPYDIVGFLAQQAAEKYIKGYLTFAGVRFPKTHDLPELVAMLPDPAMQRQIGDLTELTDLAVIPRYPGGDEPLDVNVAREAGRAALSAKRVIMAKLKSEGFSGDAGETGV